MEFPPNPYDPGNAVMPKHFAGRATQIRGNPRCFESCRAGHPTHVFVQGAWGLGKTSLLLRLHPELEEDGTVIRESLPLGTMQRVQFYTAVFAALFAKVPDVASAAELVAVTQSFQSPSGVRQSLQILMEAVQALGRGPVVIMLDELERAQPEFLGELRDLFQRLGQDGARHMLLFAGRELPTATSDATDPVRRFFQYVPVDRMNEVESVEAIRRPILFLPGFTIDDEGAQVIHRRASGHPYFLKKICHEVFNLLDGQGVVDSEWLRRNWTRIEEKLARDRFQSEVNGLPTAERDVLLHASLLDQPFQVRALRSVLERAPDLPLMRLRDRGLVHRPSRGVYEIYHPLFRQYLQVLALREGIPSSPTMGYVPEGRPVLGRQQLETIVREAARSWLDILDQHFREDAVSLLEAVQKGVRIRVLMGEDKAWTKTRRYLERLHGDVRSRVEIRAWVASSDRPFPAHVRLVLGDLRCWESSHSLGAAGQKATTFTDKSDDRRLPRSEFDRWWKESKIIFPDGPSATHSDRRPDQV